jgi:uncharacterized protein
MGHRGAFAASASWDVSSGLIFHTRWQGAVVSEPTYKVIVEKNLPMRTRDGVTLRADVYRPDAAGKFPVLLIRTPYDKSVDPAVTEKDYFPARGYVVVLQDVRGRFASEGEFFPFFNEGDDGYDGIEWAARLPWSNGRVGTVGQSYMASAQYQMAPERPPHLAAMCPVSGSVSFFENSIWRRGVLELAYRLNYFMMMARNTLERKGLYEKQWPELTSFWRNPERSLSSFSKEALSHLPLRDWSERLKDAAPHFGEMLAHSRYGPFWQATDVGRRFKDTSVPMLHVGSWYDMFQYDTLKMFTGLRQGAMTDEARRGQRLLMGPWAHLMPYSHPTSKGTGEIDFGAEALIDLHGIQLRWFDYQIKGFDNGICDEAPIRLFVMGENRWRDEFEWPLARTRYTPMYLSSGGKANGLAGDGALVLPPPTEQPADSYVYDPADPVPTRGGVVIGFGSGVNSGVYDQTPVEQRRDVLVYTANVLESDLEVTGPITMKLFASSSAPDTDFTAKLVDLRPDGYAQNVAEGIVRARFRESIRYPTPIIPGQVYEYTIDLWSTSHVFKQGHRLRLEVSSSNFPRYDRNQNTGHEIGMDAEMQPAMQTVFHDSRHPSHVILPVIPR